MASLGHLVDQMYADSGNKSVVIIGHSLGGPMTYHFLQSKSLEWKAKYIYAWVPIAAPFGGSTALVDTIISGSNLMPLEYSPNLIKKLTCTFSSTGALLPIA